LYEFFLSLVFKEVGERKDWIESNFGEKRQTTNKRLKELRKLIEYTMFNQ